MRTEKNEGMNKRSLKEVRKSAASRKATKAETPLATTDADLQQENWICIWKDIFHNPGIRFARQVAALFLLDWEEFETWMVDRIEGRSNSRENNKRKWYPVWFFDISFVYVLFHYLTTHGISDADCERCVNMVAPFALDCFRENSEEDSGGWQLDMKDNLRHWNDRQFNLFMKAWARLVLFGKSFVDPPLGNSAHEIDREMDRAARAMWLNQDFDVITGFENFLKEDQKNQKWFKSKADGKAYLDGRIKGGWNVIYQEFENFCKGIANTNRGNNIGSRFTSVLERVNSPDRLQALVREHKRRSAKKLVDLSGGSVATPH